MRLRPETIVPPHGAVYVSYTLAGGEITAQGVNAFPKLSKIPSTAVDAVSGGTGKYAGVRGEVSLQTRANKAISTFTFHFVD